MVDRILKVEMCKQVLCQEVVSALPECFMGMAITSGWGTLPLPSAVKSKPVDEVLTEATLRNVIDGGIKVNVCRRIGMLEQALCEVVVSLLPDCVMGTAVVSDWGMFPPPRIVKQKARNSTPRAILMALAKWEPVRLPEPTQLECQ